MQILKGERKGLLDVVKQKQQEENRNGQRKRFRGDEAHCEKYSGIDSTLERQKHEIENWFGSLAARRSTS